ncbi:hypothetical protein Tco_1330222 [Tanacetum coccineum]
MWRMESWRAHSLLWTEYQLCLTSSPNNLAKRKMSTSDHRARYEKHVSENVEASNRGNRRVMVHDTFHTIQNGTKGEIQTQSEVFQRYFKIFPRVQGQDFNALPTDEEIVSFLRDLGHTGEIHSLNDVVIDNKANKKQEKMGATTSKDDYLINTLRFVSAKEETQIYGAILPESLTSPEIKESKAYKTYLVSTEEPTRKSKRVKRPAKKSTKAPTRGVVIRETPEMPLSKKKEKTHPSGSEESSESGAESWGNDEDDSNNEQDSSGEESDQKNDSDDNKTQSDNENESDSEHETDENESGLESDQEENEEELNEPVDTDKEFVQEEGTDAAMTNVQQGNENSEIVQVIEDAHVTLSTVLQKTEVPFTSSSHSSDLAAKFLNFSDISHMDAEIVSLMDVHVYHEVPSKQTPTLLIVPILVITDSSLVFSIVILQSLPSFTPPPQ